MKAISEGDVVFPISRDPPEGGTVPGRSPGSALSSKVSNF